MQSGGHVHAFTRCGWCDCRAGGGGRQAAAADKLTAMQDTAARILELTKARGFALAGIASAEPSAHAAAVRRWVDDGKHGTMGWFANHLDVRLDLAELLPGAQSVIAVADAYASEGPRGRGAEGSSEEVPTDEVFHSAPASPRGKIARYAWGDDYHKVLKKRLHQLSDALAELFPGAQFRTAVDTAPALERELAARAGLGWQAKNTMLIHPRHGSYTLLGLVVTTLRVEGRRGKGVKGQSDKTNTTSETPHSTPLPLSPLAPAVRVSGGDHCANCTRCIEACPTDAIAPAGYAIDATRCVSYLTLEHRSAIDGDLFPGVRDWIAGCDICQEVCPYNEIGKRHPLPIHPAYDPGPRRFDEGLDLLEVLSWTAEDRARVFRGSALKRIKLDMIRRNALIAVSNVLAERDDNVLRDAVRACLEDESDLVRETARRVWARIDSSPV